MLNVLKKRFIYYRSIKSRNLIWRILDALFYHEYFKKLKSKDEIRKLADSTLTNGEGKKWAQHYYENHFQTLDNLKKKQIGQIYANKASPIFEKIIHFIKSSQLSDDENTYVIQLGSSSGRDLEFFFKIFPKLKYISTDINDEILNFQKEKYGVKNLRYYKCYAENIDECIDYFKLSNKKIIFFSNGSLQYVNPFFLKDFFSKIKNYKVINLFLNEPVSLSFIDNNTLMSDNRGNISFSHRYDDYCLKSGLQLIEKKVIRPYSAKDKFKGDVGHFYMQASN